MAICRPTGQEAQTAAGPRGRRYLPKTACRAPKALEAGAFWADGPKSLFRISRCAELAGIFLPRKAKNRRNTCCITRFFPGAKSRLRRLRLDAPAGAVTQRDEKIPVKAACREILNRL